MPNREGDFDMRIFKIVTLIVWASLFVAPPAYAYVDPGTGTLVLQALAAVGVGIMFYFRSIGRAIRSFFKKNSSDADKVETEDN